MTPNDASIKLRIEHWRHKANQRSNGHSSDNDSNFQPAALMPFVGSARQPMPAGLAFNLLDYIELLDWTGRVIRDDKKGAISETALPALQRLDIPPEHWIDLATHFEDRFKGVVGSVSFLEAHCQQFNLKRKPNRSNSQLLFG